MATKETKNSRTLRYFIMFCNKNPELRFWQALAAWSLCPYIAVCWNKPEYIQDKSGFVIEDTCYWEGRNG